MMDLRTLTTSIQPTSDTSLGLYLHIPFCRVRCQFCAFYVETHQENKARAFLEHIGREIHLYSNEIGLGTLPVTSVYFGGGTPTALSARQLVHLFHQVREAFAVAADAEVSIEVHPGTVDVGMLSTLRSEGFNRLSIGVQSFDDQELMELGGRSKNKTTCTAIDLACQAGFDNINLDLMYGFPGHTTDAWQRTLEAAIAVNPHHLSCYAFTVEEGSHFHQKVMQGLTSPLDEESQVHLATVTSDVLESGGYVQYEISNFCRPGFACNHNLRYWQGQSYLGLGPSAQSFVGERRFGNVEDLELYGLALTQDELPVDDLEVLSSQKLQREQVLFGLRKIQGVPSMQVELLEREDQEWAFAFRGLQNQGFLTEEEGYIRLTKKGILFADTVAVALL